MSNFCGQSLVYELILALVSLWLLVNSFKETFKEKRPIDFFDYFIIIFLFLFNWGYSMNNRVDFALSVIKWHYNRNDRLKFILSFIRRDNGSNDWLKFVKNERKENRKWTKWRWKQTKQEMNWKSRIRKLTGWRMKNRRRTVKNGGKSSGNHSRKRLGRVTEAPRLEFSSRKHIFSPKTVEMHSIGVRDPFEKPPFPIYREKGVVLATLLAQASR